MEALKRDLMEEARQMVSEEERQVYTSWVCFWRSKVRFHITPVTNQAGT
jgi:hypothetical protein